jgi:hypothetical protein
MTVDLPPATEAFSVVLGTIPEQKVVDGIPFPLVLNPSSASRSASTSDFLGWIREARGWIDSALLRHGALLFRGFPTPVRHVFFFLKRRRNEKERERET